MLSNCFYVAYILYSGDVKMLGSFDYSINRYLGRAHNNINSYLEKLSTAKSINKAADNAAGLSIVSRLESQVSGYQTAQNNIGDAISALNTADGALSNAGETLQRMRELTVQAANGTTGPEEKAALNREFSALKTNLDDIASGAKFNGIKLLDGSTGSISIQSGPNINDSTSVNFGANFASNASASSSGLNSGNTGGSAGLAINTIDLGTSNLDDALVGIDKAIDNISEARSTFGAKTNALESLTANLALSVETSSASASRIQDTDYAEDTSKLQQNKILGTFVAKLKATANTVSSNSVLNLLPKQYA